MSQQSPAFTVTAGQASTVNVSLIPSQAAAPQLVQSAGSTSSTVSLPAASTAGHLLVLTASLYTGTSQPISAVNGGGNTWIRVGAFAASGHYSDGEVWYAANAAPVTTVSVTTGAGSVALEIMEFSGVATAGPLDVSAGASNTGTAPNSGAVTPSAANDLVIGFIAGHTTSQPITVTAPGFTSLGQLTSSGSVASLVTAYKVLSSATALSFTGSFSSSMYWADAIVAFKAG
jgi:hypothetical protein